MTFPVYIGFDAEQPKSYAVTRHSLERRSSISLSIQSLEMLDLFDEGIYTRRMRIDENDQRIDDKDGKPFSTEFSFTRFLVPFLSEYKGWALFCDGDFLFLNDVAKLVAQADPHYAVMVVKHKHNPKEQTKMDGRAQARYFRKNWSSLVLWNCGHPSNSIVTPEAVNNLSGQYLHAFSWLKDEEIGELPPGWNHLVGVKKSPYADHANALHYTLGTPEFEQYRNGPYADLWTLEYQELLQQAQTA